jgi:hypothetical protein
LRTDGRGEKRQNQDASPFSTIRRMKPSASSDYADYGDTDYGDTISIA